ncbi:MAG: hypothetical protein KF833_19975 [Verrucomicrobiae bacterium]|nr:hypothetical protein [Verrucomicrobiae bacterium]
MRRGFRPWARGLAGLASAGLLLLAGSLQTVDRSPWHDLPSAQPALADVATRLAHASPPSPDFVRAGFGRARLLVAPADPVPGDLSTAGPMSWPLAGYGQRRGQPAQGEHDPLWAKAVAFTVAGRTSVVVSADLLIVPREVAGDAAERIRARTGVGADAIYFGATHTHGGPGGWGEGRVAEAFAGPFIPGVREWLAGRLADAAISALTDLAPAEIGHGSFAAPEWVRHRLVGDAGRVDPEFSLLVVTLGSGEQAVIGSYAAHATVLPANIMHFHGDYPGAWQRSVEAGGIRLAVFLGGAMGSHAPRAPSSDWEGARAMGERLAQRTLETIPRLARTNRIAFGFETLPFDLPEPQVRLANNLRLRPWLARRLLPVRPDTRLQALRLGNAIWLSTPADTSGELALDLKTLGRLHGLDVAVTSFNGDYVGYVVPAHYYDLNTYETRTMSFFGPQLPMAFEHLLASLVRILAGSNGHPDPVVTPPPPAPTAPSRTLSDAGR